MKRLVLLLALAASNAMAKEPESTKTDEGQTIVREFYDDGAIKTCTRFYPDGSLIGTLYYAPKGVPLHLDEFDAQKRVRRSVFYRPDGVPLRQIDLDEKGLMEAVREFTYEGEPKEDATPKNVRMGIITPGAQIGFTVDGEWAVIAMQPKLPIAAVAFQIKNSADENTPESTNLAISIYASTKDAQKKMGNLIGRHSIGEIKKTKRCDWTLFSYNGKQEGTPYKIRDAFKKVSDVFVGVRLAWPKLPNNPADYDARMEAVFHSVMDSVADDKKPSAPKP